MYSDPLSTNVDARVHGRVEVIMLLVEAALVVTLKTVPHYFSQWTLAIILLCSGVIWFGSSVIHLPYALYVGVLWCERLLSTLRQLIKQPNAGSIVSHLPLGMCYAYHAYGTSGCACARCCSHVCCVNAHRGDCRRCACQLASPPGGEVRRLNLV